MEARTPRQVKLARAMAIVLLASACGRSGGPTSTSTPGPITAPTRVEVATPTPAPAGPTPRASLEINLPSETENLPLDLVVIDAENIARLAPFRVLSAEDLPASISDAGLAYISPDEYELAAHLADGQLIVWNMASGAVSARDRTVSAPDPDGFRPALAISPAYDGYIATSTASPSQVGGGTTSAVMLWLPDFTEYRIKPLQGVIPIGELEGSSASITSLAFSPEGDLLAGAFSLGPAQSGLVRIWSVEDQTLIREIALEETASAVRFTLDGSLLVCATGQDLVYLDPSTGSETSRRSFDFPVAGHEISRGGAAMATWGEHVAVVETADLETTLEIPAIERMRQVEFSADESLAVLADGDLLRFWDRSIGIKIARFRGPSDFLDVTVSDNGRIYATIDEQARVLLWGVRGGYELAEASAGISAANAGSLQRAAQLYVPGSYRSLFSGNSDWLAFGTYEGIYLVDLPSLQMRRFIPQSTGWDAVFGASADARWFAWVAETGVVKVWDLELDGLAHQITGLGDRICGRVQLTPHGEFLVTQCGYGVKLWDLTTGREIYAQDGVQQVHLSPDGSQLAFDFGLEVSIWDRNTRREVRRLTGFTTAAPVTTTKFSPSWNAMYWVARVGMQFVDVESGKWGPEVPFSWGEFSPSGDRIAAVEDGWTMASVGQVHLIDVQSGDSLAVFDHHEDAIVRSLAFSPDGRLLATALNGTIKIWDARSGEEVATLPIAGTVEAFSPDGRVLLTWSDAGVSEFWVVPIDAVSDSEGIGVATARSVGKIDSLELTEAATDAGFSPDQSNMAVSTASGAIWYWELADGQAIEGVGGHDDWIYHLAFQPAEDRLISVSKDGYFRHRYGPQSYGSGVHERVGELSALAFLPDGKSAVTGGQDGILRFRDLPHEGTARAIEAHPTWIWDIAVSPTEGLMATASADRSIKLWRLELDARGIYSATEVRTLTGHTATDYGVDFAPDGRTLASASWDGTVRLWDVSTGSELAVLKGHTDWVYDVAFSPDGGLLASSSADGTIRLWNPVTGEILSTLVGPGGGIRSVAFSPDGRTLVSASDDGEVTLWGVVP